MGAIIQFAGSQNALCELRTRTNQPFLGRVRRFAEFWLRTHFKNRSFLRGSQVRRFAPLKGRRFGCEPQGAVSSERNEK
jgi:hypothetical protein